MKAMKSVTTKRGTLPSHPEGDNEAPRNATSVSKSYGAQLVRLIKGRADSELFHSPDNTPYITVGGKTMGLRQSDFKEWLSHEYYRTTDRVPSASALNDAIAALVGAALHDGPVRQVFTRVAALDDAVHIDLGDRVVEVTAAGWHVRDQSDVRFLQRPGFLPLPVPINNTQSLYVLFKTFLNVSAEDDLRLVISAVLSALRGKKPFPVLSVSGEQGSAKSSACRFLRQLIDPNSADTRLPPRDLRDLMIAARNGYLIAFDNLTRIDDTLANGLCCLSTGAGAATRALCTDTDEVLISVARPVLLNGINDTVRRPDLLDRTLQVTLDPIPDHVRKTEQEVKAAFERVQPLILGRLLDAVACALKNEPTTRPAQIPRMADFAITVTAAEPALGWQPGSFLEILRDTRRSAINGLLDGDPVGAAIQNLSLPWQGTATALRARLMNGTADPDQFPKNAKSMANRLRELAPGLRETGIRVEFVKGHTRGIKISRVTGGLTLVTPCLDSEDAEETRCA